MMTKREFLQLCGAGALGLALPRAPAATGKPLRGIFPIAQTPFTESDKLDIDTLVEELRFIDRGRVHGFVWPQLASEWSTLGERERLEGAEAVVAAGKKLRPAVVIGVQGPDTAAAVRYAKHAAKLGADALISLPPANQPDPKVILEYYKEVGAATELPLFLQAVGNFKVETILEIYKAVPTLRYVKDEAGQPLMRVGPLREKSGDDLKVFTGSGGKNLIDEMERGISGNMPAAPFADLYASAWNLWHEGKPGQAMEVFSKAAMLIHEVSVYGHESYKYLLCLRGVFKNYRTRDGGRRPAPGGLEGRTRLDDAAKQVLREMLDFVKPSLRA